MSAIFNSTHQIPVLILGTGITVLGTIRSLYRAGIPVYCIAHQHGLESHSRYYKALSPELSSRFNEKDLVSALEALPFERMVLMPCSDHWAQSVASLPPKIFERFPTSQSSLETLLTFIDKGKSHDALIRSEVPHPHTIFLKSEVDIREVAESNLKRYFLKPRDSQGFFNRFQVKAFHVSSYADADDKFRLAAKEGYQLVLQEYVQGPPSNHYYVEGFIDRNGSFRAVFTRRRLRMYPRDFGNSTLMVSIPREELTPAVQAMQRLLSHVSYRGIFSAEFKLDEYDGQYKLLEVNTRPWWYICFAADCGVNVAEMAYRDALDLDVPEVNTFLRARRSINLYCDFQLWWEQRNNSESANVNWISDWTCGNYPVLSLTDPNPALMWLYERGVHKLRKYFPGKSQ